MKQIEIIIIIGIFMWAQWAMHGITKLDNGQLSLYIQYKMISV